MRISRITYKAEGTASRHDDGIILTVSLLRKGELVASVDFSGASDKLNGSFHDIEPVTADKLQINAFDVEIESHYIQVDGLQFPIPLTGNEKRLIYEYDLPIEARPLWPWALGGVAVATILGIIVARKQKQY